jgi:large subunit ribosomal protein L3
VTLGLIGKKVGMTRLYDEAGSIIPVTVIQAGPCPILQIKRKETDGYTALQVGYDKKPERKANKPELGHFKKSGADPVRVVREFRTENLDGFEVGGQIDVSIFEVGEKVDVIGTSKGRGFASPIKRHHLSRGPETHGSMYHRRVGSMGGSSDPSRVWKGKRLAGHMGAARATLQNLRVVRVDKKNNLIVVRGGIPGHINGYVMIAKSRKVANKRAAQAHKPMK